MFGFPPPDALTAEEARSWVARLGHDVIRMLHDVGGASWLLWRSCWLLFTLRVDVREWVRHLDRFAVRSLPLLLGGSVIVGGVVAMQGLGYVSRYNATEVFGWAAALSAFREVGPLLLGLTLAARVGAKNTAELASMVARERLDALFALGLDVERVVVAPRVLAIIASVGLLHPLASMTVLSSSFAVAWLVGGQRLSVSYHSMLEYVSRDVVLDGFLRLVLFGVLIALSSTYFGLRAGRDARSIGRAVFASSVASLTGVVVVNLYLTFSTGAST